MANKVKVIVVEVGAAGRAAAAEFELLGVSCLMLEAHSTLGGRVRTVSRPGKGRLKNDAQMINGDMTAVLALAKEADLRLLPVPLARRDLCFWRADGCSGAISFGSPMGLEARDTSYDTGAKPQLTAFLVGPVARQRAALSRDVRTEQLLIDLATTLGALARRPLEFDESIWVDHPWSGGGYNAYVKTGQPSDVVSSLANWPGPVQFAGAELDTEFAGYVEGAIRSGRRVAQRVARELRSDIGADRGQ